MLWILLVAACLLTLGYLLVRRALLANDHSVFDCMLRAPALQRPRWRPGLARYHGDHFQWYPVWSFRLGTALDIPRSQILDAGVSASAAETLNRAVLPDDVRYVRMQLRIDGEPVEAELLLGRASSLGLMSWIEAGPRWLMRQ